MSVLCIPVLLLTLLISGRSVASEPPENLRKKEVTARARAAGEALKLVRFCARGKAYSAARVEAEKGLALSPTHKNLERAAKDLPQKPDAPAAGFAAKLAKERLKIHGKIGGRLAKIALLYEKGGFSEEFDRLAALVLERFPTEAGLTKFELSWFAPYASWLRKAEVNKLAGGWELHEGTWLDPKAMAEHDAKHDSLTNPWVLTDGVHEIRTNLTLREAKQLLLHTTRFREFFISEVADEWELRPAKGKLPVIVTRTQLEFREELRRTSGGRPPLAQRGAAIYRGGTRALGPCIATLEPEIGRKGIVAKTSVRDLLPTLQHELTHQLAYEMSGFARDRSRSPSHHPWCVEGIATFMGAYRFRKDGWVLTHPRVVPMGTKGASGNFATAQKRLAGLPELREFFAIPKARFGSGTHYPQAGTAAYFLLEGEGGKYRGSFLRLLETVHRVRASSSTWDTCFPGVDWTELQREWLAFVRDIRIDP